MKVVRWVMIVLAALVALAIAAVVVTVHNDRAETEERRKQAAAGAEASARTYAARLAPVFESGPQTVDSLEALARGTAVHVVTAAVGKGASVQVGVRADETYPAGWGLGEETVCLLAELSRSGGPVTAQVSVVPCTRIPDATTRSETFSVG
ncbi:hypothetical protein [Streptomyces sp. FH025]|uniref:hypothetical protein n=1 Tax=Streptomyces sp. FH025 TaxID=2815937 RepID=UPI001A9D1BE4|nr:hypothetical protein [Streptomyces sp. FH025]MBO1415048.1 hypothetical protein [Streptomyces sp. FH025]